MHVEHELPLDDVLFCSDALGVLDDSLPGCPVGVDEIGDVAAGALEEDASGASLEILATLAILGRYQLIGDLLPEVGDKSGTLHEAELGCAVVFLFGGVCADTLVAVLIPALESIL